MELDDLRQHAIPFGTMDRVLAGDRACMTAPRSADRRSCPDVKGSLEFEFVTEEIRNMENVEIADEVRRERDRCVQICRRRAELWRNTSAARSSMSAAREEARARANEASYLADLLATGKDVSTDQ